MKNVLLASWLFIGIFSPAFADTPEHESMVSIVQGGNAFASDLYKKLAPKGNAFLSPYSLSSALTLAQMGARQKTAKEMGAVLHLPEDPHKISLGLSELRKVINGDGTPRGYSLQTANGLWLQKDLTVVPSYVEIANNFFDAEVENVDFVKATEKTRESINKWVEEKTNQKIKDLIQKGTLNPQTQLVITNAVYFKGEWQERFDKTLTKNSPFRLSAKKKIETAFMENTNQRGYLDEPSFSMVEVPYKRSSLALFLFLPKKVDGLSDFEKRTSLTELDSWVKKMTYKRVQLFLPKFTITSNFRMEGVLASLGMHSAFSQTADFSGITKQKQVSVESVLHKTYVDVDEWGTEAAAATGLMYKAMADTMDSGPVTLHFDHPFFFAIRDNETGILLFMGRVEDPTKKE